MAFPAGILMIASALVSGAAEAQRIHRIMPVGDSITEGGASFQTYLYPLWEKLFAAGHLVEYVGTRSSESRVGPLRHEGYGGKNAEFVAGMLGRNLPRIPADILLIHSGHNHTVEEAPVAGIIAATEQMVREARRANPRVKVLVAQVIPSGKLPKYGYIPELNAALGKLARRMDLPGSPVVAVDMADGFDWRTDTIADRVHPNAGGAEKMAGKWFAALSRVLEKPAETPRPRRVSYKKAGDSELMLHIFSPDRPSGAARPAIVFFFGGGWTHGTPLQFYPECMHFKSKGYVAISADYRIASVNGTSPFESVADAKSAIRWVRSHAAELGVDPHRIVAAGASAGGHIAAAAGTLGGFDERNEDHAVSSRPDALVLWYPVIDNGPEGYGPAEVRARHREFSPLHNIDAGTPPALVLLGTRDRLVPEATARDFKSRIEATGGRCELLLFPGAGHPIYEYRKGPSESRATALQAAEDFLSSLGFAPSITR